MTKTAKKDRKTERTMYKKDLVFVEPKKLVPKPSDNYALMHHHTKTLIATFCPTNIYQANCNKVMKLFKNLFTLISLKNFTNF